MLNYERSCQKHDKDRALGSSVVLHTARMYETIHAIEGLIFSQELEGQSESSTSHRERDCLIDWNIVFIALWKERLAS